MENKNTDVMVIDHSLHDLFDVQQKVDIPQIQHILTRANSAAVKIVENWRNFPVASNDSNECALAAVKQCTDILTETEKQRLGFTKPLRDAIAVVNKAFSQFVTNDVKQVKESLTTGIVRWRKSEDERIFKENQKRAAEEAELRRKQLEAEKALADAKRAGQVSDEPPPVETIATVRREDDQVKMEGGFMRDNWKFEIMDAEKVPRAWCKPDEKLIGKKVREDKGESGLNWLPGIRIFNDIKPVGK